MKKNLFAFLVAAVAIFASALPAEAQFKFGLKAGVAVNGIHFDEDMFKSDNCAGFTGGAMIEFTVPVLGLGLDASVMYVRRNSEWLENNQITTDNRSYIDIPVNLKWKINIPLINAIARPYLTTGPSFSFLTSKKAVEDAYKNSSFDTAWNFGLGVELFKKVQVGANYGIGLTKALKAIDVTGTGAVEGRNKYWTITAAYLF